jgi:hypothetical protein
VLRPAAEALTGQQMKATFYLPAHPSYFGGDYTQEEIDAALALYDEQTGGFISKGNPRPKVKQEVILLRDAGKYVSFLFDSTGYGEGKQVADFIKEHGFDQYRATSNHDLQTHVSNIKETLKYLRAQSGSDPSPKRF